jgi:hypothetical protein
MYNKHTTTALYAAVIASVLLASVFAISYIQQQALAQGNQTGEATGGGTNQSGSNSTSGGGTATGGTTTGASSSPTY